MNEIEKSISWLRNPCGKPVPKGNVCGVNGKRCSDCEEKVKAAEIIERLSGVRNERR